MNTETKKHERLLGWQDGTKLLEEITEIIENSSTGLSINKLRNEILKRNTTPISPCRLSGFCFCADALGKLIIIRGGYQAQLITTPSMIAKHFKSTFLSSEDLERVKDLNKQPERQFNHSQVDLKSFNQQKINSFG